MKSEYSIYGVQIFLAPLREDVNKNAMKTNLEGFFISR